MSFKDENQNSAIIKYFQIPIDICFYLWRNIYLYLKQNKEKKVLKRSLNQIKS